LAANFEIEHPPVMKPVNSTAIPSGIRAGQFVVMHSLLIFFGLPNKAGKLTERPNAVAIFNHSGQKAGEPEWTRLAAGMNFNPQPGGQ
jgi:hypothetical protein